MKTQSEERTPPATQQQRAPTKMLEGKPKDEKHKKRKDRENIANGPTEGGSDDDIRSRGSKPRR